MSSQFGLLLPKESDTITLAQRLAKRLMSPSVLSFSGEIGAGKTTFIRAMLRALGIQSAIKSPTFSLVESYQVEHLFIHHFDLYRIHEESELEYIGFRDYFLQNAICCIEWPERAKHSLNTVDLHIALELSGSGRFLTAQAFTPTGETMLSCLKG